MMALVGCFAFEFQVVLPVLAKHDLHGGSEAYGFITAAMGVGAIVGGLWVAARGPHRARARWSRTCCLVRRRAGRAPPSRPNLAVELVAIAFVGAFSIAVLSQGNSTLQLAAGAEHAGPGDGPVGGRVPRLDARSAARSPARSASTSAAAAACCWARSPACWPRPLGSAGCCAGSTSRNTAGRREPQRDAADRRPGTIPA